MSPRRPLDLDAMIEQHARNAKAYETRRIAGPIVERHLSYTRRLCITHLIPDHIDHLVVRGCLGGLILSTAVSPGQPRIEIAKDAKGRRTVSLTGRALRELTDEVGLLPTRLSWQEDKRPPRSLAVDLQRDEIITETVGDDASSSRTESIVEIAVLRRGWRS